MKKRNLILGMIGLLTLSLAGCGSKEQKKEKEDFVPEILSSYEAEDGSFSGGVGVAKNPSKTGYSGTGYVEGFAKDEDSWSISIEVAETGHYDLNFVSASAGGEKHNYVDVDGERIGTVYVEEASFTDSILEGVYLEAGSHQVTLSKYWGWILLDKLEVMTSEPIDQDIFNVSGKLSNPNSSEITQRLYSYLCDIYGEKFLSGQTCDTGQYGKEFQVIKNTTGKTPAIIGLDFIECSPSRVEHGSKSYATKFAIDFWESGGIVTFCWHWNAPTKYLTGTWYSGFYKEHTNIDLAKIMNGEDEEGYQLLMQDMDVIAKELLELKEAGVPILFRPLHEASGGWFWWGNAGAEAYKKLYICMYEKYTKEYELDNLIWVWNGQDADWYPGDEYVDIIGTDIYPGEKVYTSQAAAFRDIVKNYPAEAKPIYMTENGCIFDPELARRDGAMWGMWCTWGGEFVAKDVVIHTLSEQYTEEYMLKKAYLDEDVITLEDLPDFGEYPIRK